MKIFLGILVFFLTFGWLVTLVSAVGLFYTGTALVSIIVSLLLTMLFLPKISQNNTLRSDKLFYLVIVISFLISFFVCHFATPTVFGGRDQGSIATAAISLSKDHSLIIQNPLAQDLIKKYGPGKALNFPGFDYSRNGTLISRFPAGYTAYLASAYNLADLKGIQYANFIPLFLFLIIFWLILKVFFDKKITLLGFLLAATFFPFLWFAKYTLTEIYMLFLVWAGILFLLYHIKQNNNFYLWISLAFFALSALTRIEGIVFFFLAAIYVLAFQRKKSLSIPKNFYKNLLISSLLLLIIYFYLNFPALLDSVKNIVKAYLPNSAKGSAPSVNTYSYLGRIFSLYNILPFLIFGLAGIIWLGAKFKKNWTKPEFLIIFITFPSFLYLLSPMITLDEPWLLRRFVFAVFPALLLYSIYFMNKFFYHRIFLYITLAALVVANGAISLRFLTLSENTTLLPQIEKISQKFGPNDLVLIDRLATGSGFSLASEPMSSLYGKNAVYFFNADDLKYINQDRYRNIYLIAPPSDENLWYAGLIKSSPIGAQIITNNFLEPSEKKWSLAQNVTSETLAVIWKIK